MLLAAVPFITALLLPRCPRGKVPDVCAVVLSAAVFIACELAAKTLIYSMSEAAFIVSLFAPALWAAALGVFIGRSIKLIYARACRAR